MARPDDGRKRTWRFRLNDDTILEVSAPKGATEKQVRRRGRWSLILATMVAGLGLIATAYADNVNADGDTVASPDNINYNNNGGPNDRACNTRGSAVSGSARVAFGGSTHFAAGQTVTVAVTPSVSGAAQGITASGGTGTVPSPWGGGGDFTVAISTTVPATAADGTYSVTVSATSATHTANGDSFSVIVGCPAADTTDPDSPSVVIDDGASWTNDGSGSVSVDISAHDAVGVTRYRLATTQAGLDSAGDVAVSPAEVTFSRADLPFTLSAGEGAAKEVWARFCDAADNCADASDTIGWDKTAPSITDASIQSGTPGLNSWYVSAVVNRFQATDGGSGVSGLDSACTTAFPAGNRDVSTGTDEGASVTVSSGPCSDVAGNTNPGISSAEFKIDLTDPSVEITSPANGLTTIATSITVSGTASDTPSGIETVAVNGGSATLGSGTFTKSHVALSCGSNTITAQATDEAGRTSTDSIAVNRLCFGLQYLQPIDQSTASPEMNVGKYGRVIPVKVILSLLGGGALSDADLAGYGLTLQMGVNGATCSSGAASDALEAYADAGESAAGTNLFRWDSSGQHWIYNLDTKAPPGMSMTINSCYRLDVYVSDGTNKVKVSTSTYALFKPVK